MLSREESGMHEGMGKEGHQVWIFGDGSEPLCSNGCVRLLESGSIGDEASVLFVLVSGIRSIPR